MSWWVWAICAGEQHQTTLKKLVSYPCPIYAFFCSNANILDKKAVLKYHPDKKKEGDDFDDEMFKTVQIGKQRCFVSTPYDANWCTAYETLSDPKKKRAYDSQGPFDDSIPSTESVKKPEDFYSIFGEAFDRNARWSSRGGVPGLGDDKTPIEQVQRFYNFWFEFKVRNRLRTSKFAN